MTKINQDFIAEDNIEAPLSNQELRQLRGLLQVARYDAASGSLRIAAGQSRLILRHDGTLRLEGRAILQVSEGPIVLDGASIELN